MEYVNGINDMSDLLTLIDRMSPTAEVTSQQLAQLLSSEDEAVCRALFRKADLVNRAQFSDVVHVRVIIEFSNHCRCKCAYCGLSAQNHSVARYRMPPEEIVLTALEADRAGYKTVILQSGEDLYYTKEMLGEIVRQIKRGTSLAVTLSVGERSYEEYRYWKDCGADRYLLKHETSDETIYNRYHPHSTFERRIECQRDLLGLGYELGGGFMVGLPGQTPITLANDILLLKRMRVSMAGIGPYISHDLTPLAGSPDGSPAFTLKALAVSRILMPDVHLPSTTALNVKGGLNDALHCGANVIMQKATPVAYRALYDIYPGRDFAPMRFDEQFSRLKEQLNQMGKTAK